MASIRVRKDAFEWLNRKKTSEQNQRARVDMHTQGANQLKSTLMTMMNRLGMGQGDVDLSTDFIPYVEALKNAQSTAHVNQIHSRMVDDFTDKYVADTSSDESDDD